MKKIVKNFTVLGAMLIIAAFSMTVAGCQKNCKLTPEQKFERAEKSLRQNMSKNPKLKDFKPYVAIVLGSGLGNYADRIEEIARIPYGDIKCHPVSTVEGHDGIYIFGYINKVPVVCMKGRVHLYEGYSATDVVIPTRLMKKMGAEILFLTNASGGLNPFYDAGTLMLMKDHISIFVQNPLIGKNFDEFGTRFPDMSNLYDEELRNTIKSVASKNGIPLEEGVYIQLTGPSYESAFESRKLYEAFGADAVGMSTAIETIAARHAGFKVCAVSCVTNKASWVSNEVLSHEEVQKVADSIVKKIDRLITDSVTEFAGMK